MDVYGYVNVLSGSVLPLCKTMPPYIGTRHPLMLNRCLQVLELVDLPPPMSSLAQHLVWKPGSLLVSQGGGKIQFSSKKRICPSGRGNVAISCCGRDSLILSLASSRNVINIDMDKVVKI